MPRPGSTVTALFDLVGHVARADSIDELQRRYLDGIGAFVASPAAGLYVLNPFTRGTESVAARGVSDFFLARYEEEGRHQDPVLRVALREEVPVHSGQLMSAEAWRAQPVYEAVFGLHRMAHLMEAPLVVDGAAIGTLNFGRTEADGPFTQTDRATAHAVARLVAAALAAVRRRAAVERERDTVVAALELCPDAVVVTDLETGTRRTNGAARRLLGALADGAAVDDLMVHAARPGRPDCERAPVALAGGGTAVLSARTVATDADPSVVVTFLELVAAQQAGPAAPFAGRGLTRREQQVADLAANGLRDAEIAGQLALSPYTVKQYLRAAYAKLGARSRVDLARIASARAAPR